MPVYFQSATKLDDARKTQPTEIPQEEASLESKAQNAGLGILKELSKKNFSVPGIDVLFLQPKGTPYFVVREISGGEPGKKWCIQYDIDEESHEPKVKTITTPKQELEIYADGSSRAYLYVGSNYPASEMEFINDAHKCNKMIHGFPKTFLRYDKRKDGMMSGFTKISPNEYAPDTSIGERRTIPAEELFNASIEFLSSVIEQIKDFPQDLPPDPHEHLKKKPTSPMRR